MAAQKGKKKPQEQKPLTALERLGLRVSAMINSPRAQEARSVTIPRMDYDDDEAHVVDGNHSVFVIAVVRDHVQMVRDVSLLQALDSTVS